MREHRTMAKRVARAAEADTSWEARGMYDALMRQFQYLERVAPQRIDPKAESEPTDAEQLRDELIRTAKR
jgi:hypothetical protein